MTIEYVQFIEGSNTPARVNRKTGKITINESRMKEIPEEYHPFVIEHEKGHYQLQTKDEIEADNYARRQLIPQGYSLKNSVYALSRVLDFNNPAHRERIIEGLAWALMYDFYVNGNKEVADEIDELAKIKPGLKPLNFTESLKNDEEENFGGRRRAIKAAKNEFKQQGGDWRKQWKDYKKSGGKQTIITNLKTQKAQNKGIQNQLKLGLDPNMPASQMGAGAPPVQKNNSQTMIIIAVVAVILIAALVFAATKMRKG